MEDNRSGALAGFVAYVLYPQQFNGTMVKLHLNLYSKTVRSVNHKEKASQ